MPVALLIAVQAQKNYLNMAKVRKIVKKRKDFSKTNVLSQKTYHLLLDNSRRPYDRVHFSLLLWGFSY